jgi:chemotaxis protein histidine kinase CheA
MVAELGKLTVDWLQDPDNNNEVLRDIRRHFHTFKGNGRAVGANVLGELGWAAQDMLDRSLDGDLEPGDRVQTLVNEVVSALPALVKSYSNSTGPDVGRIRQLTNACFALSVSDDENQQVELPEVTEVIGTNAGLGANPTVTESMTH